MDGPSIGRCLVEELATTIDRVVPPGDETVALGPVSAWRATAPTALQHLVYTPVVCVTAQGRKEAQMGDERFVYDPGEFLVNSMVVPAGGRVIEATPARPCLWASVGLDPDLVREVAAHAALSATAKPLRAMETSLMDVPLLESVLRLVRLLESPGDAPFLLPLLMRETVYRLLVGPHRERLGQIVCSGRGTSRVARAIDRVRRDFARPLSVEALSREAGLSASSLHEHFKRVTAMTPLQYQRQMRLQEARRLMVSEGLDAARAGRRVGYEDPSHFSRDYRRFFGEAPRRHTARR